MILIEDTRQKIDKHNSIHYYCRRQEVEIYRMPLLVGDYSFGEKIIEKNGSNKVTPIGKGRVDTKRNIQELASDLASDKFSLNKKYRKSFDNGNILTVLVKDNYFENIRDLHKWKSRYTKITGRYLLDLIFRLQLSYGVKFEICTWKDMPKRVFEILEKDF